MEKKKECVNLCRSNYTGDEAKATNEEIIEDILSLKISASTHYCEKHFLVETIVNDLDLICHNCMNNFSINFITYICFDCGVDYYKNYQREIDLRENTEDFICKAEKRGLYRCRERDCPKSCNRICFNCFKNVKNSLPYCRRCSGIYNL